LPAFQAFVADLRTRCAAIGDAPVDRELPGHQEG